MDKEYKSLDELYNLISSDPSRLNALDFVDDRVDQLRNSNFRTSNPEIANIPGEFDVLDVGAFSQMVKDEPGMLYGPESDNYKRKMQAIDDYRNAAEVKRFMKLKQLFNK